MTSNLEIFKNDLEKLISDGGQLLNAMQFECHPKEFEDEVKKVLKTKKEVDVLKNSLPSFKDKYQHWYSESLAIINFLIPARLEDFVKLYEKPKGRKDIAYGNYVIEDYLQGLRVTTGFGEAKVEPRAAIPQFQQQLNILKSAKRRFESSLFDIKQLLQADLFDSELDAAKELLKNGFLRAAGAVVGVVLEKHLEQICKNHNIVTSKKDPSISDYNDLLKNHKVIEIPTWRFIQHLGDLRNLCDHNKKVEPTKDNVNDLIEGADKIIKTVF
ncbi:MAG TPA: hypothetical protein DCX95_06830 [Elusimicrobia bacterium]|nr:hypothetical protein [Elusimicrobiota bacterium]